MYNAHKIHADYDKPYNGKLMSDRQFRCRSFYKKYAQELGIKWQKKLEQRQ